MALWCTMGDIMQGSGWPECIKDSGLANNDRAALAFLKADNVMRTRYAHQVTVVVMNILLNRSYDESGSDMSIEDWIKSSSSDRPTFQIWYFIIQCKKTPSFSLELIVSQNFS